MEAPLNLAALHPHLLLRILSICAPSESIGRRSREEMSVAFVCKNFYKLYMESHVKTLDLSDLPHVPEPSDFKYFSSILKSVTAIDLADCRAAISRFHTFFRRSDAMQAWSRNIKSLACSLPAPDNEPGALWVTESVMYDVFETIPYEDGYGLTSIFFNANMALTDKGLWAVCVNPGCWKNLICLELRETGISDIGGANLMQLLALQTLRLDGCRLLGKLTFLALSNLKNMRALSLSHTNLQPEDLYLIIKGMPHLEDLNVLSTSDMSDRTGKISDLQFSIVNILPEGLSSLSMTIIGLTNDGMATLVARCKSLKRLSLDVGPNFDNMSLLAPICPNLHTLSLGGLERIYICPATIKLMKDIEELRIWTCHRLTLPVMNEILALPNLQTISIKSQLMPENAFSRLQNYLRDCRAGLGHDITELSFSFSLEMDRSVRDQAGYYLPSGTRQAIQRRYQEALYEAQLETESCDWVSLNIEGED
jgi:hypothetical protein